MLTILIANVQYNFIETKDFEEKVDKKSRCRMFLLFPPILCCPHSIVVNCADSISLQITTPITVITLHGAG